MKQIFLFILLLIGLPGLLKAQLIDNKLNVLFGYHTGGFNGKNTITEGTFQSPSLFANFNSLNGISLKATYKIKRKISLGIDLSTDKASDWVLQGYSDYNNASASQTSVTPFIQLHSQFLESGRRNRIRMHLDVGPMIGKVNLKLQHPVFFAQDANNNNSVINTPLSDSNMYFGIKAGLGIQYSFNRQFGVYAGFSEQIYWVKSSLYNDNKVSAWLFDFGIFVRLKGDKHYYY